MNRIVVVGTSGSGKSTVSKKIGAALGIPVVELDNLHWGENWTPVPLEVFESRAREAAASEQWIVDGNYHVVRDIVWPRAEVVVWLDYDFTTIFRQVFIRTITRAWNKTELWSGNRESWRMSFFSRESILLWVLKTYRRRKKEYPLLFQKPEFSHLQLVRLQSHAETAEFLRTLTRNSRASEK